MWKAPPVSNRTRFLFATVGVMTCLIGALCAEWALGRMNGGALLRRYHLASLLFITDPETTQRTIQPPPPPQDVQELQRRLDLVGAQTGEVQVSLAWNNLNDLDLSCLDPNGEMIDGYNQSSRSGGVLDVDMNVTPDYLLTPEANANVPRNANTRFHRTDVSNEPVENLVWRNNAPVGHYKVFVHQFCNKEQVAQTPYWVVVRVRGTVHKIAGVMGRDDFAEQLVKPKLVYEFDVPAAKEPLAAPPVAKPRPAAPPPPPRIITHTGYGLSHLGFGLLVAGVWGVLAGLLPIALLAAQRLYLRQPAIYGREDLIVGFGGPATGFIAAVIAQLILALIGSALSPGAFPVLFVFCWILLGGLFGSILSIYTPNVSRFGALVAGSLASFAGSTLFLLLAANHMDAIGRILTASLIGGAIGALIALPEREREPDPEPETPRSAYEIQPPFIVHGTRTRKVGGLRQTGPPK